jgi:hypothetical protein
MTFFRSVYQVDSTKFSLNQSIDEDDVMKEITEGNGYQILSGLYSPEDIDHARQTILYLIGKQGSKATHFQVITYM